MHASRWDSIAHIRLEKLAVRFLTGHLGPAISQSPHEKHLESKVREDTWSLIKVHQSTPGLLPPE